MVEKIKKEDKKDTKKEEIKEKTKPLESLEELEKEAKENEEIKKEKPKRVRHKKEPDIELDNTQTSMMLDWLFDTIAERAGTHWKLNPKESQQGAILINKVILKYAPVLSKYSEELGLAMWSFAILIPRLRNQNPNQKVVK